MVTVNIRRAVICSVMSILALAGCDRKYDTMAGLRVSGTLEEPVTKLTISDEESEVRSHWQQGDVVHGFWKDTEGVVKSLSYNVSGIGSDGTATFRLLSGEEPLMDGTAVHMVYGHGNCCSGFDSSGKAVVDIRRQDGTFEGLADRIIFCSSANVSNGSIHFSFRSMTAIINIRKIEGIAADEGIGDIQITACGIGTGEVSLTDGGLSLVPSDALSYVRVGFTERASASAPVWFMTLPVKDAALGISVRTGDDFYSKALTKTLGAGRCVVVSKLSVSGGDFLEGEFTIDADGDKVRFSKGNLQAVRAGGKVASFGFAANQYDILAASGQEMDVSSDGTYDLFGWSTAASDFGLICSGDAYDYTGEFVDWCAFAGPGCRTLSSGELEYLLSERAASTVRDSGFDEATESWGYEHENSRFFQGLVNGRAGLFLLPDSFMLPDGVEIYDINGMYNGSMYAENPNSFTEEQFRKLEAAGAVFLPAASFRNGIGVYEAGIGKEGKYWTSSAAGTNGAGCLYFDESEENVLDESRHGGNSVRPVMEVL